MPLNINTMGSSGISSKLTLDHPYCQTTITDISNDTIYTYLKFAVGCGPNGETYQLVGTAQGTNTTITVRKHVIENDHVTTTDISFTIPEYIYADVSGRSEYGATLIPDPKSKDIVYFISGTLNGSYNIIIYKFDLSTETATLINSSYCNGFYIPSCSIGYMTMTFDFESYKCYSIAISNSSGLVTGNCINLLNGTFSSIYNTLSIENVSNLTEYNTSILPIYGTKFYVFQYSSMYGTFWLLDASTSKLTKCVSPYTPGTFSAGFKFPSAQRTYANNSYVQYLRYAYSKKINDDVYIVGYYGLLLYVDVRNLYVEIVHGGIQDMMMNGYKTDGSLYINTTLDSISHGSDSNFALFGIGINDPYVCYIQSPNTIIGRINLDFIN